MRIRRVTALFSALVMVFSLLAGFSAKTDAVAAVTKELPLADGLYLYDWVPHDGPSGETMTDKDQNGNTVLVDESGEAINYRASDGWYLKESAIKAGEGVGIQAEGEIWIDYVTDGKKVTHVPFSKLKFTNLEGAACDGFDVAASERDSRAIEYSFTKDEPVLVTYTGAKKNNAMVIRWEGWDNFYTSDAKALETVVSDNETVAAGGSRDFYMIFDRNDDEDNGISKDVSMMVTYWDDAKGEEITLSEAADVAKFVTTTVVKDDPRHLVIKVTANGVQEDGIRSYGISASYRGMKISDPTNTWHEDTLWLWLNIVEPNSLLGLDVNWQLTIRNGEFAIKDDSSNSFFSGMGYRNVQGQPIVTAFRHVDEKGVSSLVTDPKDLTFYYKDWNETTEKDILGEKVPDGVISVQPVSADSPLFAISYNPTNENERQRGFAVGYKDKAPNLEDSWLDFYFMYDRVEDGFYTEKTACADTYAKVATVTGLEDITLYMAMPADWGGIVEAKCEGDKIALVDESGKDFGAKVAESRNAGVTYKDGSNTLESWKIVIPAGTLKSSAVLTIPVRVYHKDGENWVENFKYYFFYNAPAKNTTFTKSGVTYKVTGKSTVSVSKVKTSAKSVTIPASVCGYKVTGIAANAMKGCKKLTRITVKSSNIKTVGKNAFSKVPKKAVAKVPKAKKKAYKKLFKKGGFKGKVK